MPRAASVALQNYLNAAHGLNSLVQCDIYYFGLQFGLGSLLYTTGDYPVTAASSAVWNPPALSGSGGLWQAGLMWQPGLVGGEALAQGNWNVGLDPDTWSFDVLPRTFDPVTQAPFPDQIAGQPWMQAARQGALDGADLIVATAYFTAAPTYPLPPAGVSPLGTIILFRGQVGPVKCTTTRASIQARDYRAQLDVQMPRNVYQASCRHTLFDSRCTLDPAGFTATATASAGSQPGVVNADAAVAPPAGSGTFILGTLAFTGGPNAGYSRLVADWNGARQFVLQNPFPYPVTPGDTFTVTAGCDKSTATCTAFANLPNFGGFPYVPIPEVSAG